MLCPFIILHHDCHSGLDPESTVFKLTRIDRIFRIIHGYYGDYGYYLPVTPAGLLFI